MCRILAPLMIALACITPLPAIEELPFLSSLPENPTTSQLAAYRVMPEPLWPVGEIAPTAAENTALETLLRDIAAHNPANDCLPTLLVQIEAAILAHPDSPWNPSLRLNLGLIQYREGFFSRALDNFNGCLECLDHSAHPRAKALAERALGEFLLLNSKLGRIEVLEPVFEEIAERSVGGVASELLAGARMGLATMLAHPETAFRCGPMALDRMYPHFNPTTPNREVLLNAESTVQGTSLWQNIQWATQAEMPLRAAQREPGTAIPLPALVHWKCGHYAAVTGFEGGRYHIEDGTFHDSMWISAEAMDDESSGAFLIPDDGQPLPPGWNSIDQTTAESIWGKGYVYGYDEDETGPCDRKTGCGGSGRGMAVWNVHLMAVSLNLIDTPVAYSPPFGPEIAFTLRYNQRDVNQPSVFAYSNFGPKWTSAWISAIIDNPNQPSATVKHYLPGGGAERYYEFNSGTGLFDHQKKSRSLLQRTSTDSYKLTHPDGTVDVFDQSDGITTIGRRIFLTSRTDPQGNAMELDYDGQFRITTIRDAMGAESELFYEHPTDSLKITKVRDHFGREALLEYDSSGRLIKITDPEGIESEFTYADSGANADFIEKLTTPYGDTHFSYDEEIDGIEGTWNSDTIRWIEIVDPMGLKQRVEYRHAAPGISENEYPVPDPGSWSVSESLDGIIGIRGYDVPWHTRHWRNTFHWDTKTMREMGGALDYSKAHIYQWLHSDDWHRSVSILESEKPPLENRIYYNYQEQHIAGYDSPTVAGPTALVSKIARAINDDGISLGMDWVYDPITHTWIEVEMTTGTSQISQFAYNDLGFQTRAIDPAARETERIYAANQIDLLAVRQKTGASTWENFVILADYQNHLPWKITDASGQETNLTWNTKGQLETITDPLNRTTTHTYDHRLDFDPVSDTPSGYGYLYKTEGPVSGSTTTFTYDSAGRAHTTTDSAGHILTFDYDNLDRPIRITFPDETYEELTYGRPEDLSEPNSPLVPSLDVHTHRDRLGRITTFLHNANRQLMVVKDSEGRITQYDYCSCGSINRLIDANGNTTRWRYDIQGRLTKKIHPDKTETNYTYDPHRGNLATVTDALGQILEYEWHLDDNLASVTPANPIHPTAAHHYTWDPHFSRIATLTDGTGTTTWTYHPHDSQTLGAGQIDTITTAHLVNSTLAYEYDELGRQISRSINGIANESTRAFDALGRVETEINRLGTFDYHYVGETSRLDRIDLPHNHSTHFSYESTENDHRLTRIEHRFANSSILAAHDYGHTADGTITRWTQERSGLATRSWHYGYDAATRLTSAILKDPTESILQQHGWQYDPGDNRIAKWSADLQSAPKESVPSTFNHLNQLLTQGSGPTRIAGIIDEPGTVTINGAEAKMRNQTQFESYHDLPPGTHQIDIEATDFSDNTATQSYEITIADEPEEHFDYDLNGNLTERTGPNGTTTYHWDAFDRLIAIQHPDGTSSHFTYHGMSRRVRITEKDDQEIIIQERKFLWDGLSIVEERSGSNGGTVEKRFYGNGVELVTVPESGTYTYRTDHLGSIREVVGASGSLSARYDYDTWGVPELVSGSFDLDFRYTGHFYHAPSTLHLAPFRAYDANLGRWISRDPIEENGGINLYAYVENEPLYHIDPYGLQAFGVNPATFDPKGGGGRGGTGPSGGAGRGVNSPRIAAPKCPNSPSRIFGKTHRFKDGISTLNLKNVRFPKGKKMLEEMGLTHQINPRTGRHQFVDSKGREIVAYDPGRMQPTGRPKKGHWHKFGYDGKGQRYALDNSGRTTDPSGTAAHIPCK